MARRTAALPAVKLLHPPVSAAELVRDLPAILTLEEAAAALRCSTRQIRYWVKLGKLQSVGLTKRIQIPRPAIEALLARALDA